MILIMAERVAYAAYRLTRFDVHLTVETVKLSGPLEIPHWYQIGLPDWIRALIRLGFSFATGGASHTIEN